MKYFSIKYWRDWDVADPIGKAYRSYIQTIRPNLPRDLQTLAAAGGKISLNDGTINSYFISVVGSSVDIEMDCQYEEPSGSLGQRRVLLHYKEVESVSSNIDPDGGAPHYGGYGDHGFDEIELIGVNLYEHRMLFESGIEIAIRFREFSLEYVDTVYSKPATLEK